MGVIPLTSDSGGSAATRRLWRAAHASIADNDPYFKALQAEMADKGFLVTSSEALVNWARTGSADVDDVRSGLLCAVEMMQASMPRYDLERFRHSHRALHRVRAM